MEHVIAVVALLVVLAGLAWRLATEQQPGRAGKLYRNTDTFDTPTWSEVKKFRDLSRPSQWATTDADTRGSEVGMKLLTMLDTSITGLLVKAPSDANYQAIRDAHENGTAIDLCLMDGDITTPGKHGFHAMFIVSQFSDEFPLRGEMVHNVTLEPTPDTNAPEWYTVSS